MKILNREKSAFILKLNPFMHMVMLVWLTKLFEKRLVSSIIPQCPRSETRTMMKHKGKVLVKEHVEKLIKKKPMFKAKGSQKMLEWMKMDSNKLKWVR
jgi:hypothetical protein